MEEEKWDRDTGAVGREGGEKLVRRRRWALNLLASAV